MVLLSNLLLFDSFLYPLYLALLFSSRFGLDDRSSLAKRHNRLRVGVLYI
jgi:hypothetical protein